MNTSPAETLKNFLSQQSSQQIIDEFNYTKSCYEIYHPNKDRFNQRKPTNKKAIITPKQQVFFYYLNLLSKPLITKFHSLSATMQATIQSVFRSQKVSSSSQAITTITNLIGA